MCTRQKGFSLVELAVVLLIIGLLVGGTLGVQSMIRNAELNSVASEAEKIQISTQNFYEKYNSLPGDMPNATAYWGRAHADADTCKTTTTGDARTCNGDGDGKIGDRNDNTKHYEYFRAWQHLNNAGMVEGQFSGVTGSGGTMDGIPGVNLPMSRIKGVGPRWLYNGVVLVGDAGLFEGVYKQSITFGKRSGNGGFMTPEEMFSLDTKFDDGRPAFGIIYMAKDPPYPSCTTTGVAATAAYNMASSEQLCWMGTRTGF